MSASEEASGMDAQTSSILWTSASRSHPGRVRQVNEDSCLEQSDHGVWAVADGMGGHSLGEFASGLAMQSLVDLPMTERLEDRVSMAVERLWEVNRHLRAEAPRRNVPLIGTTVAALVSTGNYCSCLWAGDSRIYLYRGRRLKQLTRDHNHIEAARWKQVSGYEDTVELPQANYITHALGAEDSLHIDQLTLELQDGDIFLLCTDGLSNVVSAFLIEQALLTGICRMACDALVDMALDRKARDNVTAVVVHAEDLGSPDRTIVRMR